MGNTKILERINRVSDIRIIVDTDGVSKIEVTENKFSIDDNKPFIEKKEICILDEPTITSVYNMKKMTIEEIKATYIKEEPIERPTEIEAIKTAYIELYKPLESICDILHRFRFKALI